jgi:PAP2 superfamily
MIMARTHVARVLFGSALVALLAQPAWRSHADAVTDWNVIALNATEVPPNAILQSRVLAIVHGAVYDAVRAVDRKSSAYAVDLGAPADTSVDAAVAAAAHGVLVRLAPAQRAMVDAALDAALARIADGRSKTEGIRLGSQIAEKIVAVRSADKSDVQIVFTPKPGAGLYQLTPPHSMAAILPHWGGVTPFVLRSRSGLEFKGPPGITSAEFARDFDEVKSVGARSSRTRTADQTAAAIFWTVQTGVPWFAAARAASAEKRLSVSENARLFAVLSMATADSQIVGFEEKYKRLHWRPITAIRAAAGLGIPTLEGDPSWEPLLVTPPQPDYPSAHAIFSGAAESVLRAFFGGDDVNVSVTFPAPFGVNRTYRKFSEMAEEVDNARVWGGIHFRSAVKDGSDIGRKIGTIVVRDFPKPATN